MKAPLRSVALGRYLDRHCERGLPSPPDVANRWQNVLVLPAYREQADCLHRLQTLGSGNLRTLVILVLNRPETDPDANVNKPMRDALSQLPVLEIASTDGCLRSLSEQTDIYLLDTEQRQGPLPADQGVGLARKTGCDLALAWIAAGKIETRWIVTSDADATLPDNYFETLDALEADAAAACFPFWHRGQDSVTTRATSLYELRLHHYVLGLEYAQSPYAFHTLGSCIAVRAENYAQVRGFPARSGGEDFYLLNKIAKTGQVRRLDGNCIELEARASSRAPFGTGPAVARLAQLAQGGELENARVFYHPLCFRALGAVIDAQGQLANSTEVALADTEALSTLPDALNLATIEALETLNIADGLAHCRRQSRSPEQFSKQFHQWFDGFRTLKFIHAIRELGWKDCSLQELLAIEPQLWPGRDHGSTDIESLRQTIAAYWQWNVPSATNP